MLRILHISDTHLGPSKDFRFNGSVPYFRAKHLLNELGKISHKSDLLIHTGDVSEVPVVETYELARDLFEAFSIPSFFIAGNHDDPVLLNEVLRPGNHSFAYKSMRGMNIVDTETARLILLNAKGPESIGAHGQVSGESLSDLTECLKGSTKQVLVFTHFPPFSLDSTWVDERMLLLNGAEFHAVLARFRDYVKGVFFGHLHRGVQFVKDGILYISVNSTCVDINCFPTQTDPDPRPTELSYYNLITVTQDYLTVKQLGVVPRDVE